MSSSFLLNAPIAGWAVAVHEPQESVRHRPLSYESWALEMPGPAPRLQVPLLSSAQESRLLGLSCRAGLSCWVTGSQFIAARMQLVVLHRISLWVPAGRRDLEIPPEVCRAMLASAASEALSEGLQAMVSPQDERLVVSPTPLTADRLRALDEAHELLPTPVFSLDVDSRRAAGFVVRLEAEVKARAADLCWPEIAATRHGGIFEIIRSRPGREHTAAWWRGPRDVSRLVRHQAPGLLFVSWNPELLYRVVALLCLTDVADTCRPTTLIIAPRHIFPAARAVLQASLPPETFGSFATRKDVGAFPDDRFPQVVLSSLELMQAHNPFGTQSTLGRMVLCGWPHTAEVLKRSGVLFEGTARAPFTLGLALESDLQAGLVSPLSWSSLPPLASRRRAENLSDLFDVPSERFSFDPVAISSVLSSRFLRLAELTTPPVCPSARMSVSFSVIRGPALSDAESKRSQRLRGPNLTRSFLFGSLCGPRGPFLWIPSGGADAVQAHFRRRAPLRADRADAYAIRSYGQQDEEDSCCPICFDPKPSSVTLCGHWFCGDCLLPALETAPACPVCKCPTDLRTDVVSIGRPIQSPERMAFFDFLGSLLRDAQEEKTVVLCSHGELHEKLAATLKKSHVLALPWGGNARQISFNFDQYVMPGLKTTLLVDPVALSPSWCRLLSKGWPRTDKIYLLAPLSTVKEPACCQIRTVLEVFRMGGAGSPAPPVSVVCRTEEHLSSLEDVFSSGCRGSRHGSAADLGGRCVEMARSYSV